MSDNSTLVDLVIDPEDKTDNAINISIVRVANAILGSVSIVCALIVLVVLTLIRLYDGRLVNRISLRLCAAISAIDIGRSIGMALYFQVSSPGNLCMFTAVINNFMILSHMFLTAAIALNLQLVFLNHKRTKPWWEPTYFGIGLGFPLVLTAVMAGLGSFGYNATSGSCFYKEAHSKETQPHIMLWLGFLIWNVLGPIYCLTIVFITSLKLKSYSRVQIVNILKPASKITPTINRNPLLAQISPESISLLIRRVCFYCFVPIVSQAGCVLGLIWEEVYGQVPIWIAIFDSVASHSSGILNLIGFLNDPALRNSVLSIRNDFEKGDRNPAIYHTRPWVYKSLKLLLVNCFPNFYPPPGPYHLSRGIGPDSVADLPPTPPNEIYATEMTHHNRNFSQFSTTSSILPDQVQNNSRQYMLSSLNMDDEESTLGDCMNVLTGDESPTFDSPMSRRSSALPPSRTAYFNYVQAL